MQSYDKSQDNTIRKKQNYTTTQRELCSAVHIANVTEQAELINEIPQHEGMWIRRDAMGNQSAIEDWCNPKKGRKRLVECINCWSVETGDSVAMRSDGVQGCVGVFPLSSSHIIIGPCFKLYPVICKYHATYATRTYTSSKVLIRM